MRWVLRLSVGVGAALIVLASASKAWAFDPATSSGWKPDTFLEAVVSTAVFGVIGIVLAVAGFKLFDRLMPGDLEREICEKQNVAAGILGAAVVLGVSIIIAAAVL